jgi:hypothetical protein
VLPDSSSTPPERVYVRLQKPSNSEAHYEETARQPAYKSTNAAGERCRLNVSATTVEISLPKLSPLRGAVDGVHASEVRASYFEAALPSLPLPVADTGLRR